MYINEKGSSNLKFYPFLLYFMKYYAIVILELLFYFLCNGMLLWDTIIFILLLKVLLYCTGCTVKFGTSDQMHVPYIDFLPFQILFSLSNIAVEIKSCITYSMLQNFLPQEQSYLTLTDTFLYQFTATLKSKGLWGKIRREAVKVQQFAHKFSSFLIVFSPPGRCVTKQHFLYSSCLAVIFVIFINSFLGFQRHE